MIDPDFDVDDGVLLADVTDIGNVDALLFGQSEVRQHFPVRRWLDEGHVEKVDVRPRIGRTVRLVAGVHERPVDTFQPVAD